MGGKQCGGWCDPWPVRFNPPQPRRSHGAVKCRIEGKPAQACAGCEILRANVLQHAQKKPQIARINAPVIIKIDCGAITAAPLPSAHGAGQQTQIAAIHIIITVKVSQQRRRPNRQPNHKRIMITGTLSHFGKFRIHVDDVKLGPVDQRITQQTVKSSTNRLVDADAKGAGTAPALNNSMYSLSEPVVLPNNR